MHFVTQPMVIKSLKIRWNVFIIKYTIEYTRIRPFRTNSIILMP